jgi:hypothetical protein
MRVRILKLYIKFLLIIAMRFGIDVHGMDDIMNPLRQQGRDMNTIELNQWAAIIESTAKQMCNEVRDSLELRAQGTMLHFLYEDERSKECLIRAIERHLYLMPFIVQSIFRKLLSDLKSGAY